MTEAPPPLKAMCATCPFREDSPYRYLVDHLSESAIFETSRLCHSTGTSAIFPKGTGKQPKTCRGARDLQLQIFHALGVISEPTDAAWDEAWAKLKAKRKIK